jgi:hypothetical protein
MSESVSIASFIFIMQPTQSVYLKGKLLKVRFHCLGRPKSKAFQLSQLDYPQLLAALVECFKIE